MKVNIYDIAKKAEVSIATVSRVINNSGYVGKKTREKVLKIIEDSGYMPSRIAQSLSTSSSMKIVGIVCYNIEDLYYAKAVSVLERRLSKLGYDIILSCTGESLLERQRSVDMLIAKNVDAIIFIGSVFAGITENVILNASKHLPVFIINAIVKGENVYCAYCDEREAVSHCVRVLDNEGKRKILFMYDAETYSSSMKLKGFKNGLSRCKIPFETRFIIKCEPNIKSAIEVFSKTITENDFNAVICANDMLAAGVLSCTRKLKISVPDTLRVVGCNNSLLAESLCLTSIENNVEKLAIFTASNLNKYFSNKKPLKKHKLGFNLVIRKT